MLDGHSWVCACKRACWIWGNENSACDKARHNGLITYIIVINYDYHCQSIAMRILIGETMLAAKIALLVLLLLTPLPCIVCRVDLPNLAIISKLRCSCLLWTFLQKRQLSWSCSCTPYLAKLKWSSTSILIRCACECRHQPSSTACQAPWPGFPCLLGLLEWGTFDRGLRFTDRDQIIWCSKIMIWSHGTALPACKLDDLISC